MVRSPAVPQTRMCEVRRQRRLPQDGGDTLFLTIHGLSRRARFARPDQIPEFEGERAFFEVEPKRGVKLGYVFLRQVEAPGRALAWYG